MELIKGKSFGNCEKYCVKNNFTAKSTRGHAVAMSW